METRANYVLIGIFTLVVIAGGFLFVMWFTGLSRNTQHKTFEIVFNGSVSGLSRGSLVSFNGLRVGEVTSIDFLPAEPGRVAATIEINALTPVKTDTVARLESQGLTGVATLALIGGSNSARELGPGPLGEPAIIYAEPSDFQNLLETVQHISTKADDVLTKINKVIDDNSSVIGDTLHNVDDFSKALNQNSAGLKTFLASVSDLGQKLAPLSDKLQALSSDIDNVVKAVEPAKVKDLVSNVDDFSTALARNKGNVDSIFSDAASVAKRLDGTSQKLDATLDSLLAFSTTLANNKANIDSILADAAALTKKLGDTPGKLNTALDQVKDLAQAVDRGKVATIVNDVAGFTQTISHNQGNIDSLLADSASLAKRLNGTSQKLDNALDQVSDLAKAFDHAKIAGAVDNVTAFTETLNQNRGNVDRALKNASELAAKLNGSADQVDGLLRSLQGLIGSSETQGAIGDIGAAARSIRLLADNVDQRVKDISGGLSRFSNSGLREYEALAVDGRRTINDIDRFVHSLSNNPSQVIFGAKPALPDYRSSQ
jgi:phospholipid/cholesterol/gamma-HCH transport system substrate-binding protein